MPFLFLLLKLIDLFLRIPFLSVLLVQWPFGQQVYSLSLLILALATKSNSLGSKLMSDVDSLFKQASDANDAQKSKRKAPMTDSSSTNMNYLNQVNVQFNINCRLVTY